MDENPCDKSLIYKYFGKSIDKNIKVSMIRLDNDKKILISNKSLDKQLLEKFGKYFFLLIKYKKI